MIREKTMLRAMLIVDGWEFYSTVPSSFKGVEYAEQSCNELLKHLSSHSMDIYKIELFSVHISSIYPETMKVKDWHKEDGRSVWRKLP